MRDCNIIDSVVGFDLTMNLYVPGNDGSYKILSGGIRSSVIPVDTVGRVQIGKSSLDIRGFTTFNQALLDKLRDYQKRNL